MRFSSRRLFRALAVGELALLSACGGGTPSGSRPSPVASVLIVGGGESHDFPQWYQRADSATIAAGGARVAYTDAPAAILPRLSGTDVLYLAANQPLPDPALRDAIFRHVAGGGGLIVGHAGAWYNWSDWPEYNRRLVGGGARGHRRYGTFEVEVVDAAHPVTEGVPPSFIVRDELYRFVPDSAGPEIHVLARAREADTGEIYPVVWTVESSGGRILVNTLGHDGDAHNHQAYQRLLRNSVRWTSRGNE